MEFFRDFDDFGWDELVGNDFVGLRMILREGKVWRGNLSLCKRELVLVLCLIEVGRIFIVSLLFDRDVVENLSVK